MNQITRPPLSTTNDAASATLTKPAVQSLARGVDDLRGTVVGRADRLTRRSLDRLASVATLGMILASPRSALLMDQLLGPRTQPSTSTTVSHPSPATRPQGVS
jgi:hypothetical protein